MLFTEYASTLFQVIHGHLEDVHGYADDHQVYLAFSPDAIVSQFGVVKCMENCLLDIKQWMLANKPKMNDAKTEFTIIGSRQQLDKIVVVIVLMNHMTD